MTSLAPGSSSGSSGEGDRPQLCGPYSPLRSEEKVQLVATEFEGWIPIGWGGSDHLRVRALPEAKGDASPI